MKNTNLMLIILLAMVSLQVSAQTEWVDYTGNIPSNAVVGGKENNQNLPLCRCRANGGDHTGKVVGGKCNIGLDGSERSISEFQILINKNNTQIEWVRPIDAIAPKYVEGGYYSSDLKICQCEYKGGTHPGSVQDDKVCRIGWGGSEVKVADYKVLIYKNDKPKLESEDFEVILLRATKKVWDDKGSGANRDVSIWQATPPDGFFTFGHCLSNKNFPNDSDLPITIAVRPKPGKEDMLRRPSRFDKVWSDAGSGADKDVKIFRMKCDPGYVALGMVASDGADSPNDQNCRCIKESATSPAQYYSLEDKSKLAVWDDAGSGADKDVALWQAIISGNTLENQVSLAPGTFYASLKHHEYPTDDPRALNLVFNVDITRSITPDRIPQLNHAGWPAEDELRAMGTTNEYTVPFFAIQDDRYKADQLKQFLESPIYKIYRKTYYNVVHDLDNSAGSKDNSIVYTLKQGIENENNYQYGVGLTYGYSVTTTVGAEAGISKGPVSAGVSTSVAVTRSAEFSFNTSWGGATRRSKIEERSTTITAPAGKYAALFQVKNEYEIKRSDGTTVQNKYASYESRGNFVAEYPPVSTTAGSSSGSSVSKSEAINFDGSTNYVSLGNLGSVNDWTMEFWFKPKSVSNYENLLHSEDTKGNSGVRLEMSKDYAAGRLYGFIGGRSISIVPNGQTLSTDWHHLAIVGDKSKNKLMVYLDGVEVVNQAHTTLPTTFPNFVIGRGFSADNNRNYNGLMDEFRIWNFAKTKAQVDSQKDTALSGNEPGLTTYYNFDQGTVTGTTLKAQKGDNGTLNALGASNLIKR